VTLKALRRGAHFIYQTGYSSWEDPMRRLVLVLLTSALAVAAVDAAQADSLQVTPQRQPYSPYYGVPHGRSMQSNVLPAPGTDNRYFSDTLTNSGSIQGPGFMAATGGSVVLPCHIDVWGCF
jgi:hypothetical protein